MRQIQLTRGKVAIVDDTDYERLTAMGSWCYHKNGYAVRGAPTVDGKRGPKLSMHRVILDAPDGSQVDHINGDRLDNRRSNLRLCSHAENMRNRGPQANSSSGIKGVGWHREKRKWHARIKSNGRLRHLGYFNCPYEAATAYDKASQELHGDFGNPSAACPSQQLAMMLTPDWRQLSNLSILAPGDPNL